MGASAPPPSQRPPGYRGRFAPSPTGTLHFGSLVAAVASFADARSRSGDWLVRMEDLDRPREVPGAAAKILRTLTAFGLCWDGEVLYQSTRADAYRDALERLNAAGLIYPCACTRTEITRTGRPGPEGPVYPGTCREGLPAGRVGRALRVRADGPEVGWRDRIQGEQAQWVSASVGDFVLRRADGLHAYQLAVVVDDAHQGVTQVVRGADLLSTTARQILLQRFLGLPTPDYAHVPLALGPDGRKLSKSLASIPVDAADPLPALRRAWAFLGQAPLSSGRSLDRFWSEAAALWRVHSVPRCLSAPACSMPPANRPHVTVP